MSRSAATTRPVLWGTVSEIAIGVHATTSSVSCRFRAGYGKVGLGSRFGVWGSWFATFHELLKCLRRPSRAPSGQLVLTSEGARDHSVDVQRAVEVIHLVLHDARGPTREMKRDRPAAGVDARYVHL